MLQDPSASAKAVRSEMDLLVVPSAALTAVASGESTQEQLVEAHRVQVGVVDSQSQYTVLVAAEASGAAASHGHKVPKHPEGHVVDQEAAAASYVHTASEEMLDLDGFVEAHIDLALFGAEDLDAGVGT